MNVEEFQISLEHLHVSVSEEASLRSPKTDGRKLHSLTHDRLEKHI